MIKWDVRSNLRSILGYDEDGIVRFHLQRWYGKNTWVEVKSNTEYINADAAMSHCQKLWAGENYARSRDRASFYLGTS